MPLDPDTEIQYRKGGKIMKKIPRKFQSGGQTEAPKTGMELERENVRKDRATQQGLDNYNAGRPTMLGPRVPKPTPPKPSEKPPVAKKKGGKIRKFSEGGDTVTGDTRERRADEKPREEPAPIVDRSISNKSDSKSEDFSKAVSPETDWPQSTRYGRFSDQTYADAYKKVDEQLRGGDKKSAGGDKKSAGGDKKSASTPAPKAASKPVPKAAVSNPRKAGNDPEPYSRREEQTEPQIGNKSGPKKDYGERGNMRRSGDFELSKLKSRSVGASDSEKDVTQRIKDSLARTRAGSDSSDSRSVSDRLRAFADENPNTAKALEVGSMLLPVGGAAVGAARLARGLYTAKKARDATRTAEAATAAKRAPRDVDEMRFADEGNPNFKRGGGVKKYAKGGGVEAKGKTKGKIVKMAKGGSVRGYGISKVTNKTKYV